VGAVARPLAVAALGIVLERLFLRRLYDVDPLYNLLLTFGLTLCSKTPCACVSGSKASRMARRPS